MWPTLDRRDLWSVYGLFLIVSVTLFFSECYLSGHVSPGFNFAYLIGRYLGTSFSDRWVVYFHTHHIYILFIDLLWRREGRKKEKMETHTDTYLALWVGFTMLT